MNVPSWILIGTYTSMNACSRSETISAFMCSSFENALNSTSTEGPTDFFNDVLLRAGVQLSSVIAGGSSFSKSGRYIPDRNFELHRCSGDQAGLKTMRYRLCHR